jgi:hypothetical protein
MTIDITLNDLKEITANSDVIGKTFENKAVILCFHLTEKMLSKDFYLDIEKPDGTKFRTSKLIVEDNKINFEVPNSILDISGFMNIEVILQNDDIVEKYPSLTFKIEEAINAIETLPEDNPTLLMQIEKVVDIIDTDGDGTKYLCCDGTYKEVSAGTTDYDSLENQPIKRIISMNDEKPIILRNLESGAYLLHGWFKPYDGSTETMAAQTPIIAVVATTSDTSYIQLFFPYNNMVQYFEITDNSYKDSSISFNDLLSRIEALEGGN